MRRFAIFAAVLTVIVIMGSRPAHPGTQKGSFCVCVPTRAKLMLKSMMNKSTVTAVHDASVRRVADEAALPQ